MKLLYIYVIVISVFISGCSNVSKPVSKSSSNSPINKIPKVPQKILPGGDSDDWRYLGSNSQLVAEISESSISLMKESQVYTFVDRKRVIDPDNFAYTDNVIKYKYILSSWLINCNTKQYKAISASTYSVLGNKIRPIEYKNDSWHPVIENTISQIQYNYICLGINRNLGY